MYKDRVEQIKIKIIYLFSNVQVDWAYSVVAKDKPTKLSRSARKVNVFEKAFRCS